MTVPRYNIQDIHNKIRSKEDFPLIIENQIDTHDVYFFTVRFEKETFERSYNEYRSYFQRFHERLNDALRSNCRDKEHSFLIMYPEQYPVIHFHGILFLNKKRSQKFERKCVSDRFIEYSEKLRRDVECLVLTNKIINPYRSQSEKELTVENFRLNPLKYEEDRTRAANYSLKNFVHSPFEDTDMIATSCIETTFSKKNK